MKKPNATTHTYSHTKSAVDRYISVIGVVKNAISRTFDLPKSIKLLGSFVFVRWTGIFGHKSVMVLPTQNFPLLSNDVGEKSFSVQFQMSTTINLRLHIDRAIIPKKTHTDKHWHFICLALVCSLCSIVFMCVRWHFSNNFRFGRTA